MAATPRPTAAHNQWHRWTPGPEPDDWQCRDCGVAVTMAEVLADTRPVAGPDFMDRWARRLDRVVSDRAAPDAPARTGDDG